MELDIKKKMEPVIAAQLPGFYVDARGAYGIVFRDVYICCFVNPDDGQYDVTADMIGDTGNFDKNCVWDGFDTPEEAVRALQDLLYSYRLLELRRR